MLLDSSLENDSPAERVQKEFLSANKREAVGESGTSLVPLAHDSKSFLQETPVAEILANPKPTVDVFIGQINVRWQKSVRGIIEAGQLAYHAHLTLKSKDKKLLMDRLQFKKSYFSKLVQIGRDKRLQREEVFCALPANITFIYSITHWTDEDIATRIKFGKFARPAMPRSATNNKESALLFRHSKRVPVAADRVVQFDDQITPEQIREVDAILYELENRFPVSVGSCSDSWSTNLRFWLLTRFPRDPAPLDQI